MRWNLRTSTLFAFSACSAVIVFGACAHRDAGPSAAAMPLAASTPPLFDDLGHHHRPISTRSALAQRYFDQGLRLIYAFNHDEARRDFEQAARLDPRCAICWWGVALALGPNYNLPATPERARQAYAAAQRAQALSPRASPVEQALIVAIVRRYSDPPPGPGEGGVAAQVGLDTAYVNAMAEAARRFPDDIDVATLYAESLMDLRPWRLWGADGKPAPCTIEAMTTLEGVLDRAPDHPGANHYYIHVVEASPHPEQGLPSAQRLASLMPGAGHLVHMPSHIYFRIGRYADAAEANRRAVIADTAYLARAGSQGFYAMYLVHNYQFLAAAAAMQGRSAEALRAARAVSARMPREMVRHMPGMDYYLAEPWLVLARFGRWDEVLAEPAPPSDFKAATAMWRYARGRALTARGRLDEAARELDALHALARQVPADVRPMPVNAIRPLLEIAGKALGGELALRRGQIQEGLHLLEEAVSAEDSLGYMEPPDWYYPVRQSLGAWLLATGRAGRAEAVYRADLRQHPNNGWSLFGLAQSLRAQRKTAEATAVERRFQQAWERADVPLASSVF